MPIAVTHPRFLNRLTVQAGAGSGLRIFSANFRFDEGGGELTGTITPGTYYVRRNGGGAVLPTGGLLNAIEMALNTAPGVANTYSVTQSTTGFVTIARSAGVANFTLRWATGVAPRFDGSVLGFDTSANDGPGTTFTADWQHRFGWYPEQYLLDGYRYFPTATVGSARSLGGQQYTQRWNTDERGVARVDFVLPGKIRFHDLDQYVLGARHQSFSHSFNTSWEGFYEIARDGVPFEVHPNVATVGGIEAVLDPDEIDWMRDIDEAATLQLEAGERYRVTVPWRSYNA